MLSGLPFSPIDHSTPISLSSSYNPLPYGSDPNGTLYAFNATLAQFDLYNLTSATMSGSSNGTLTPTSAMINTVDGSAIPGTGFKYAVLANKTVVPPQTVNWTLIIPRGVGATTYVRFDWNGTLGPRTSARYLLYNGTGSSIVGPTPFVKVIKANQTFTVETPLNSTGGIPLPCGTGHECVDVSRFAGYNMTLIFMFNSTSTGGGLNVRVSNVEVASTETNPTNSASHSMELNSSNEVAHKGRLSLSYNATVTFPYDTNKNRTHTWKQMLTTFVMPAAYVLDSITFNGTSIVPALYPFDQGNCNTPPCTNGKFVSINMTATRTRPAVVLVNARSANAITNLIPTVLGVPTTHYVPGDLMTVRMTSSPAVNVSASQQLVLVDPNGMVFPGSASSSNKGGTYLYNVTVPLSAKPGSWLVNGTFTGGYDFGTMSKSFTVEQVQPIPGSFTTNGGVGSGTGLSIRGTLVYKSSSQPAGNVNATIFAVDSGASPGPVTSQGLKSSGLYINNVTLANGVFTVSQSLTMFFAVVNPTTQPVQPFNATVTIEHEWYTSQTHGVSTTFNLTLGDQPFTNPTTAIYRADITLGQEGIQLQVRSVTSPSSPPVTLTMSNGISPVTSARQHSGKFRITITSTNKASGSTTTSPPIESPAYAFTLDSDLIPSRLLASSPTVPTASDGAFSTSISSTSLLGAKNLVLFALGRDADGVTLLGTNVQKIQKTSFFSDSSLIIPSADIPSDVATRQTVTVSLNLKSNSTYLPLTLTVNLYLSGSSGVASSQTVTVPAGSTKPVSFTFQAPGTAGAYLLTFASPDYFSGAPLLTKTLQVSVLSSNLQILIPALIGLVVALVILGYYAMKRGSRVAEEEEEEKPKSTGKPQKPQSGQQNTKSLTRS